MGEYFEFFEGSMARPRAREAQAKTQCLAAQDASGKAKGSRHDV